MIPHSNDPVFFIRMVFAHPTLRDPHIVGSENFLKESRTKSSHHPLLSTHDNIIDRNVNEFHKKPDKSHNEKSDDDRL
jgi:hypothetical protein